MEKEWYQARSPGKSTTMAWAIAEGIQATEPPPLNLGVCPPRPAQASQRSREESERRLLAASEKRKRQRQKRRQQQGWS